MRLTVDEIQSRIAAVTNQDESTANLSTEDYSLRLKYLNMAQKEWAETYDWQVLYTEYHTLTSTSTGNASIALPNNFRKLASYPQISFDGATTDLFKEVKPTEDSQYAATTRRVWKLGAPDTGYVLRVLGTDLISGASIRIPYYRSPASLATTTDIPTVPNADFLIERVKAYIWEDREDARYKTAKFDSEKILQNLIEFEETPNRASDWDRVKSVNQTLYKFRLGRD